MRRIWFIAFLIACFAALDAAGEAPQLPRLDGLAQAWTSKLGGTPDDLEGRVALLCFVRDAASRSVRDCAELASEVHSDAGDEHPASVVVLLASGEEQEAMSLVREASPKTLVAIEQAGGPLSEALRGAGIEGDALLVFARSGRVVYASAVAGEALGNAHREARRVVAEELGSAEIEVRAHLPNGDPAEGCRVTAVSRVARRPSGDFHTDKDGVCRLGSLFGPPVTLFVFDEDSGLSGFARVEDVGLASVSVQLEERDPVAGSVLCRTGELVPGARVEVELSPRVDGRFPPHRVEAGAVMANESGRFEISWLPEDIYASFDVSGEGWWPENVKGLVSGGGQEPLLNPLVLYPVDRSLAFVLLDLEGQPLPGARCRVGRFTLRSDEEGRIALDGTPDKALFARVDSRGLFNVAVRLAPGLDTLAVATAPQVAEAKERFGIRDGAPPWKVEAWVAGEPVEPKDAKDNWLVVALVPRDMAPEDRDALLKAMRDWSRAHRSVGLRAVAILPCGTPEESAAEIASRFAGLSVAVDAPIESAAARERATPPGYTEALWRGWGRWETICFVQDPSGRAEAIRDYGDVSRVIERVKERLRNIERNAP